MKLLIDDAKAEEIVSAACTAHATGMNELATTLRSLLTDRRTMLARIAELEKKLEATEVALTKSREELSRTEVRLRNAREEIDRMETKAEELEAERDRLREYKADVEAATKQAMVEQADEKHCTCVPLLRAELANVSERHRLAEVESADARAALVKIENALAEYAKRNEPTGENHNG